jgi:hypothetical protein
VNTHFCNILPESKKTDPSVDATPDISSPSSRLGKILLLDRLNIPPDRVSGALLATIRPPDVEMLTRKARAEVVAMRNV